MGFALGIDIGSTSVKAVIYDPERDCSIASGSRALPPAVIASESQHELDPLDVEGVTYAMLAELKSVHSTELAAVDRIGFTGQMHGGMAVDQATSPITNFITWQDKRADQIDSSTGKPFVERLRQQVEPAEWEAIGSRPYTGYLAATIHATSELQTSRGTWCSIYDWVAARFTNQIPITDITTAAAWGMFRIADLRWSQPVLDAIGMRGTLPEVVEPGAELGRIDETVADRLGVSRETIVCAGIGDTQASYIGSGCNADELLLNFGTGSQSMWESGSFVQFPQTDTRYLMNGRYLHVVPTLAGGKAYQVLCDFYRDVVQTFAGVRLDYESVYRKMNELGLGPANGLECSPLFSGSRYTGERERGTFTGIDLHNLRAGPLTSSLLAGMIEEVVGPFERATHERITRAIVGSGNAMRLNPALRQAAEARLQKPLRLSRYLEEAATGAAMVAAGVVKR